MTDDTQDQRQDDLWPIPFPDLVRDVARGGDRSLYAAVERILAARCPGEGPTEPEPAHRPRCQQFPTGWLCVEDCTTVWREGPTDNGLRAAIEALADEWDTDESWLRARELRAVLAEHAPTEGPTRQAAAQALRDAADALGRESVDFRQWWKRPGGGPEDGAALDTVKQTMEWLTARADRLAATPEDGA